MTIESSGTTSCSSNASGIATETLKAGDRVTITGHAMRDPNLKVLSLLSEIQRPGRLDLAAPAATSSILRGRLTAAALEPPRVPTGFAAGMIRA